MKAGRIYIIKVGTTFPDTAKRFGDFDTWTAAALGPVAAEIRVIDVEHGAPLPLAVDCAGVVVTGSHAMVTDELSWSVKLERWVLSLIAAHTPFWGICYGHQLLAKAAGGKVGFHPKGKEIGTVEIKRLTVCESDPLFQSLPDEFLAHVTHAQSVLSLPPNAIRLAANIHEPNHAFRIGECAWGVQFHPEYTADIMSAYIEEQANELTMAGKNISTLLKSVEETPVAVKTLRNFARFVECRMAGEPVETSTFNRN